MNGVHVLIECLETGQIVNEFLLYDNLCVYASVCLCVCVCGGRGMRGRGGGSVEPPFDSKFHFQKF